MPNKSILKKLTIFLALIISSALAWGDQKKTSAPPPKPAPATSRPSTQPQPRQQQPVNPPRRQPPVPVTQPNKGQRPGPPPGVIWDKGGEPNRGPKPPDSNQGRISYRSRPGDQAKVLPGGGTEFHNANGQTVTTNARGEVQRIEVPRGLAGTNKMVINHGPRGGRVVETGRPGARVVSYGPNRGFVERPLRPGYISRTYVAGGRSYAHVYREYRYHNMAYYRYVPGVYYNRRFYAWAVTPWGTPVHYVWFGMATPAPWFGYYRGYFIPYPVYASPDLWLTDYLLAENLRLAYENEQAAYMGQTPPPPPNQDPTAPTLSPEVKAAIAAEVKQQLADEQAAAANPPDVNSQAAPSNEQVPEALSPTERVFVVASSLDLTALGGGPECSLSPGDVLMRLSDTPDANQNVNASVQSSKKGDCTTGQTVAVSVQDLQEMHNHFREQLDSGLNVLTENRAKGLPNGPTADPRQVAEGTAEPAPGAESQLAAQDNDAAKLEAQVKQN